MVKFHLAIWKHLLCISLFLLVTLYISFNSFDQPGSLPEVQLKLHSESNHRTIQNKRKILAPLFQETAFIDNSDIGKKNQILNYVTNFTKQKVLDTKINDGAKTKQHWDNLNVMSRYGEETLVSEVITSVTDLPFYNRVYPKPTYMQLLTYFRLEREPFKTYELNSELGQSTPVIRQLPDTRPPSCLSVTYPTMNSNMTVSIIVPFYNELWAMILRNVHSILEKTPAKMLHEIILIDDCSDKDNLIRPMEGYIKWLPKIRLLRTRKRVGLIRARMAGARAARGNVLVFLDAHVEVNVNWLEPLLSVILQKPSTIAVPSIDIIEPETLEYRSFHPNYKPIGSFTWELDYIWVALHPKNKISHMPYETATMIGCAFAVDKNYFFSMGGFDEGMDIWGGENLEISFRTWQCGGSMKISPCSRVGHVFRNYLPYSLSSKIILRNLERIAEVWMDNYRRYFYTTTITDIVPFTIDEKMSLEQRKKLRKRLNCKSFDWYLTNVATYVYIPETDAYLFGQIKSIENSLCLITFDNKTLGYQDCYFLRKYQNFVLTTDHQIKSLESDFCMTLTNEGAISMKLCDEKTDSQKWMFNSISPNHIKHRLQGTEIRKPVGNIVAARGDYSVCLTQSDYNDTAPIRVKKCDPINSKQYYVFTHRFMKSKNWRNVS